MKQNEAWHPTLREVVGGLEGLGIVAVSSGKAGAMPLAFCNHFLKPRRLEAFPWR
jgi:hypothetical protein